MEEFIRLLIARMMELGTFTEAQIAIVQEIKAGSTAAGIQRLVGALDDTQWQTIALEIGRRMRASILAMDESARALFDQVLAAHAPPSHPPATFPSLDQVRACRAAVAADAEAAAAALDEYLRTLNEVRREAMIKKMTRPQADLYRAFEEQRSFPSLKAFVSSTDSFEDLMRIVSVLELEEQGLLMTAITESIAECIADPAADTLPAPPTAGVI